MLMDINLKIGFIGTGNMAEAMLSGISAKKITAGNNITVSDISAQRLERFNNLGFSGTVDNCRVVENSDYIFLTVKPQLYPAVLAEIAEKSNVEGKIFITVAPGITIKYIKNMLGDNVKVVRTMPNTPALVGEGVTAAARGDNLTDFEFESVKTIISAFSDIYEMSEEFLDTIISVSGSSPAYVYMFIDALARSGEKQGMDYNTCLKMAAKTVLGSAKLLLNSEETPEALIDRVCSKGGTTIEAVSSLKNDDFYGILDSAMRKCTKRAIELRKEG